MNSLREAGQFVGAGLGTRLSSISAVVQFVSDAGQPSLRTVIAALQKVNFTVAESTRPLYRRSRPWPQDHEKAGADTNFIDLTNAQAPTIGVSDPVAAAVDFFDARAAAAVNGAVGTINSRMRFIPGGPGGGHLSRLTPSRNCWRPRRSGRTRRMW